jgi:hypothetical protein
MNDLFYQYKNRVRKHFGLKTKKNRIIKKYFHRFLTETMQAIFELNAVGHTFVSQEIKSELESLEENVL